MVDLMQSVKTFSGESFKHKNNEEWPLQDLLLQLLQAAAQLIPDMDAQSFWRHISLGEKIANSAAMEFGELDKELLKKLILSQKCPFPMDARAFAMKALEIKRPSED